MVSIAPGNRKASFVHGDFTVSTEGDWYLGVIVKPNEVPPDPEDAEPKLVYVASLTCFEIFE
ncbi:MAG: hypothetical protein Q8Q12_06505 [bacterium]|nr:hypothetical protein [bacterium]